MDDRHTPIRPAAAALLLLALAAAAQGAGVGVHQGWKAGLHAVAPRPRAIHQARATHARSTPTYPGSPYTIDGLLARRALNPARFDHYHPMLGPDLARDARLRAACAAGMAPTNGLFPASAFLTYLQHRRSLNPARFDTYHPTLGPLLAEDQRLRGVVCPMPEVIMPPPLGGGGGNTGTGGGGGSGGSSSGGGGGGVPEPSTFVLIAIGATALGGRAAWRCRRARG